MSETKFTPSPWFRSHLKGEHRHFVMAGGERVATVAHNRGRTPAKANANLIAAAPDLYEALLPIAQHGEISAEIINNAKGAIEKARGAK